MTGTTAHERILAATERIKAQGETNLRSGRDPVNQPMINNWIEAIGDTDPRWTQGEAPPAMAQVWTMGGLRPTRSPDDPLHAMIELLSEEGFTGVLGTNCEQEYARTLAVGEEVTVTTRLESVVGPKQTGVGEGYFVTTRNVWRVAHPDGRSEQVATMLFRVLKFVPKERPASVEPVETQAVLRPQVNRDTAHFWEGTAAGELRIQQCGACGALRHPPGPSCPECHAFDRRHVVASGRGTVYSYVVHRHPPIPGRELPVLIALVELEEGTRLLAEVVDCQPEDLEVGMRVTVDFQRVDDDLTLPVFRLTSVEPVETPEDAS